MVVEKIRESVTGIFLETFNEPIWWLLFIISIIAFFALQKIGERVYANILTKEQKEKTSKTLFGAYVQGITHAIIIFVGSVIVIFEWLFNDEYVGNSVYGYCAIVSCAYYVQMIVYELCIPQSAGYRLVMVIHHIFCCVVQFPVYIVGPSLHILSALGFQCEISNVFMNIAWFAQQCEHEKMYFLGGIGTLFTFPITRVLLIPLLMYNFWNLPAGVVPISYWWFAVIAQWFVLLMSLVYTVHIVTNPKKILNLTQSLKSHEA